MHRFDFSRPRLPAQEHDARIFDAGARVFVRALAVEPENVDALAGVARMEVTSAVSNFVDVKEAKALLYADLDEPVLLASNTCQPAKYHNIERRLKVYFSPRRVVVLRRG